jgi:hypothetical protein
MNLLLALIIMERDSPKSAFVAPILTATPNPCRISALPIPIICIPTIRSTISLGFFGGLFLYRWDPHKRVCMRSGLSSRAWQSTLRQIHSCRFLYLHRRISYELLVPSDQLRRFRDEQRQRWGHWCNQVVM